jgi:hypothetical protein
VLLGVVGCGSDDPPAVDAGSELDAGLDAGLDAAPEDAAADDDAGDAADAGPVRITGDDYVYFPELVPKEDGELIVRFAVPRGARSFVLTVSPATPRRILLVSLHGPGDTLLFDGLADEPSGPLARAITHNLEEALPMSVLYPNAPDAPFGPGIYTARLYLDEIASAADPTAAVDVVLGRPIDDEEPRRLGIQIWVAAGASLTPDDIIADDTMLSAFTMLRSIFEDSGIEVPDIGLTELGTPADALAVVDGPEATLRVLDALAGYPGRGLHVVLVDRIEAGAGKVVLGKTTGIPTPPVHDELERRGAVLVSLESLPADADRIAELIAHEAAHSLGLRHTSEAEGDEHDPLADTPECPAERATFETSTGQLVLTAEDCEDLGGDNLLFYTPPRARGSQRALTADQAWVLSRNPTLL